jgi:hypothetical protein
MERALEDRVLEQAEAWDEVAVDVRAGALGQAPEATASAPSVGKKRLINRARPAMSNNAPNAAPP